MKGLDLSKFKKTAQDKISAKLMHPDGHSITIAVAGLSPDMRKKLAALPLHQAEPEGEVESPEPQVPEQTPTPTQVPDPEQVAPAPQQPENAPQEVPQVQPQQASAPAPFPSDLARTPQTPLLPNETPEEHYAKEVAFQQDLANRHIEPKTYSSMFAKKDTLGKIGTIFGLMLSGAGSGLAHQPNLLLDMMNKEIDRDLEAQKQSKANANTFLQTQQAHDLQQAQMLHMSNQNALAQQQIKASQAEHAGQGQANAAINKKVVEQAGGHWDNSIEKENAAIGSDLSAKNKMLSVVAQNLDDVTPNNPQAKQAIQGIIRPAIDAEIKQNSVKRSALQKANADARAQAASDPLIDRNVYNQKLKQGNFVKSINKPGLTIDPKVAIDPGDQDKITEALDQKRKAFNNYKDAHQIFSEIAAMKNAGESTLGRAGDALSGIPLIGGALAGTAHFMASDVERPRQQRLNSLAQRLSKNGESAESVKALMSSLTPSMFDSPEGVKNGAELLYQHFEHSKEAHPEILQKYEIDKPLPAQAFDPIASQKAREGQPFNATEDKNGIGERIKKTLFGEHGRKE